MRKSEKVRDDDHSLQKTKQIGSKLTVLENKKRIEIHLHSEEFAKDFKICHSRAICTYSNKLFKDCDYDKLVLVLRKLE